MNGILNALTEHARTQPDTLAFFGHSHAKQKASLTYAQLDAAVEKVAQQLRSAKTCCMALKAENSLDWVVTDLAAMRAGVTTVPVPTFFSAQQIAHLLTASGADLLIGDWPEMDKIVGQIGNMPAYRYANKNHVERLQGTHKITFTSGSTGTPKGVCLSHSNLDKVTLALSKPMQAHSGPHLVLLPLSTLLENITGIYLPLVLGVTSAIFHGSEVGLSGSSQFCTATFAHALTVHRPASMVLTPALLMALIQVVKNHPTLAEPLKVVAVGGARVAPELIQVAHQIGIPALEGYGLSEFGSVVSMNTHAALKPGTCGQVLSHSQVKLAKDGELLVKGNLALGYLNQPFVDEWLATGDLAEIDDEGFITIMGRKKNQIITSFGRNISPEWIESQAQLFAPNQTFIVIGEEQSGLTAVVDGQVNIMPHIQALNQTLPDYARIQQLLVVTDLTQRRDWFTDNGRPKRGVIESAARYAIANPQPEAKSYQVSEFNVLNPLTSLN